MLEARQGEVDNVTDDLETELCEYCVSPTRGPNIMYALTRSQSWRKLLLAQAIPFLAALLIAETYYKFHSFVLECVAFLATWYAIDWLRVRLFGR